MSITLAFDVYGTLIDTHGVIAKLNEIIGSKAEKFSQTWREKQLEYSFRRGLMQNYENFSVCTSNAFDYTCTFYKLSLTKEQRNTLLDSYRTLPAFSDVKDTLISLKKSGFRIYAFSNGSQGVVETLLEAAGLKDFFIGVVSVDDIKSFKPDPAVYNYFLKKTGVSNKDAWLISSNSFDVMGAISSGMNAAWLQRSERNIYDPLGNEPTVIVKSLLDIEEQLSDYAFAGKTND